MWRCKIPMISNTMVEQHRKLSTWRRFSCSKQCKECMCMEGIRAKRLILKCETIYKVPRYISKRLHNLPHEPATICKAHVAKEKPNVTQEAWEVPLRCKITAHKVKSCQLIKRRQHSGDFPKGCGGCGRCGRCGRWKPFLKR